MARASWAAASSAARLWAEASSGTRMRLKVIALFSGLTLTSLLAAALCEVLHFIRHFSQFLLDPAVDGVFGIAIVCVRHAGRHAGEQLYALINGFHRVNMEFLRLDGLHHILSKHQVL